MSKLLTASFIVLVLLQCPVFAKPWRGITPLVSTRSEVERVLGNPVRFSNYWGTYYTQTESISILYSNGLQCGAGANSDWNVPEGRVITIMVSPKEIVPITSLKFDESKYQKSTDPHMQSAIHYSNIEEGESFSVVNGEITGFHYTADLTSNHLRCPRKIPELTATPAPIFDNYGDLDRAAEESRLDNFAIELLRTPGAIGHIHSYSNGTIPPTRARERADRAKNYVIRVHRVDPLRVITAYKGKRTDFTIELYITLKTR